jgi:dihydroflavonol-4-reductase
MKVLVTGATGFLGGWLVRRLLNEGIEVRVLARSGRPGEELEGLPIEVVRGDVTVAESLVEACRGVDSVFHLAGLIAYTRAQREAMERINIGGTANIIEACVKNSVRRLVHLSSVVAIGASFDGKQPLTEDSPYNVRHLNLGYFETKKRAEELVVEATRAGRIESVILNPSTIYGPGDAKKGSRGTQLKVARGRFPFYTSGGVNVVAVEDVVDCIVQAWKTGHTGERYIVAGENILIRDLFRMIAEEAGVRPPNILLPTPIVHMLGHVGDALEKIGKKGPLNSENAWTSTLYHWFDSGKAQRELGLKPKPARHAIHGSVQWIKDHGLLRD